MGHQLHLVLGALIVLGSATGAKWYEEKFSHRSKQFDTDGLRQFAYPVLKTDFESLLDPILIERVSGSEGNRKVANFIKTEMKNLGWDVETDGFESDTPEGRIFFENIIATLNPNAARRLVIACHYDSKLFKDAVFVGATDSAVPCAMMLHLAHTLRGPLEAHRTNFPNNVTLQFIFFDGEEAFREWTNLDSLYGSRHLAAKWEKQKYALDGQDNTNYLHRIDMMVLLDLIGTKNPTFSNFFPSTSHWHGHISRIEEYLRNSRMWTGNQRGRPYFPQSSPRYGGIDDDHVPFLQRNVDILHVIAAPFPDVWHTPADNKDALDFPTIDNLNRILRVFVATYLHLQGSASN